MIIEIPTGQDFKSSSLALLNLAWTSASASLSAYRASDVIHDVIYKKDDLSAPYATVYTLEERREAERKYWVQSQHSLGNALSLVQQSVEMALRGRIAEVSPFLLVMRDPRDLPKNSTRSNIPFSAFRSIDASDLVRVHNTFCPPDGRLDAVFEKFWEALRRQRNLFIHTVRPSANVETELLKAEFLIEHILLAVRWLHPEKSWFQHRVDHSINDEDAIAYQVPEDAAYTFIMKDFVQIIEEMSPKALREFFGLDKKNRRYACPACLNQCDTDYLDGDEWEQALCAQLHPKGRSADDQAVKCTLCQTITPVVRQACINEECRGNVLAPHYDPYRPGQLICLLCDNPQDENDARRLVHHLPKAPKRDNLLRRPLSDRIFREDRQPPFEEEKPD